MLTAAMVLAVLAAALHVLIFYMESIAWEGPLARYGNNHFGIKCHATWNGKTITHDDDEKSECFRKYRYAYESFEDHSQFLMKRGRYSSLFELNPTDYESWAHGLKRAGYATDPAYAKKLIALIKKFSLHQYDEQVVAMKGEPVNFSMGTDIVSTPLPKREVPQVVQNEPIPPAKPAMPNKAFKSPPPRRKIIRIGQPRNIKAPIITKKPRINRIIGEEPPLLWCSPRIMDNT